MEQRESGRRALRLTSLAAGLALVLGACSSGASQSPTAAATSAASQPAAASAATSGAPSGGASGAPSGAASGAPGGSAAASGGATGAALEDTCAKGAEEGALVEWNNHSEEFTKVIEAFNEKYPDIEVENLTLSPDEAAQRILAEASAGRAPTPDVAAGGLDVFKPLLDENVIATDVDWPSLGVPPDVIHPDAKIVRIHRIATGIGYNTDKVQEADLPTTWEELVDAKWKGRVIVDPRGRPFDQISLAEGWGKDKTLDYVNRLKSTVAPLVIEGGTAGLVAVAGGEADITTGARSAETLEQKAKNAPLEIKYLDVVTTIDNYNVVMAKAAHPNAARCYIGWFASEGQAIYNEVEFKTNDTVPTAAPQGAEVVTIESPEDADAVKDIGKEIGKIWTGG
jgi:iron(III) transport system substrate-binding protein